MIKGAIGAAGDAGHLAEAGLRRRIRTFLEGEDRHALQAEVTGAHGDVVGIFFRSEEHTSELQSLMRISYAVFCLKKKNNHTMQKIARQCNHTNTHIK